MSRKQKIFERNSDGTFSSRILEPSELENRKVLKSFVAIPDRSQNKKPSSDQEQTGLMPKGFGKYSPRND